MFLAGGVHGNYVHATPEKTFDFLPSGAGTTVTLFRVVPSMCGTSIFRRPSRCSGVVSSQPGRRTLTRPLAPRQLYSHCSPGSRSYISCWSTRAPNPAYLRCMCHLCPAKPNLLHGIWRDAEAIRFPFLPFALRAKGLGAELKRKHSIFAMILVRYQRFLLFDCIACAFVVVPTSDRTDQLSEEEQLNNTRREGCVRFYEFQS